MRQHQPRHPAEVEAWTLVGQAAAWRPRVHPAFGDPGPLLDWAAVRCAYDAAAAPWHLVRAILNEIQIGARKAAAPGEEPEDDDG